MRALGLESIADLVRETRDTKICDLCSGSVVILHWNNGAG